MEKFIINGGKQLQGTVSVSGAKNVALKTMVAACLTEEEVVIENVPLISDLYVMAEIIRSLGGNIDIEDHVVRINFKNITNSEISLEKAGEIRTSSMFIAPLLVRTGIAIIPNPGGCRIGARPIDRTVDGLEKMGAVIKYVSDDGYFHATTKGLKGTNYRFEKNTHTGTETLVIAAVLAKGKTVLENAAQEPEIDELIDLLNRMGANVMRVAPRTIEINGVEKLHGAQFTISPDRNEIITFAVAALITKGDIFVKGADQKGITAFLDALKRAGGGIEKQKDGIRFYYKDKLIATDIITAPYPGFMTDWQGPWTVLMTKAQGVSVIHETVYENRFQYVKELNKMGAHIELFNPKVDNFKEFYNFNIEDDKKEFLHAAKVVGSTNLHNGVVMISDLRAGATLVLAALAAEGKSAILGIELLERGYERFDERLRNLGADIQRIEI